MNKPTVGRIVHYVSYGTPGGEYASACRAAVVAGVPGAVWTEESGQPLDLVVLNPTGLFFNRCTQDEGQTPNTPGEAGEGGRYQRAVIYRGGTWHWPIHAE